jgi:predicted nucleic acid-binding protein
MVERNLLYAEQALSRHATRGDKIASVVAGMPRVIVLNILEDAIRDHEKYHQVIELAYREPPYERATDRLAIHNLQLDLFRAIERKPTYRPLDCWLTAICRAQDSKKKISEVIEMDEQLRAFYEQNPGFAQFSDRHDMIASAPEVRTAFRKWEIEMIIAATEEERQAERQRIAVEEGMAKGRAEGRAEGETDAQIAIAVKYLSVIGATPGDKTLRRRLSEIGIADSNVDTAVRLYAEGLGSREQDGVERTSVLKRIREANKTPKSVQNGKGPKKRSEPER